ncbi:AAA family ATPase [Bradyrhizobium cytisi]|uniref:AAA family ATPase n=1 Tax=Bradyrhizobium cytisi TaxID=515489 RepID=UPI001652FEC5|nr:AAA family ATPase [Bradyrhizobium cytisi]
MAEFDDDDHKTLLPADIVPFRRARPEDSEQQQPQHRPIITAEPYVWIDPEKLPLRDWLYGRLLVRRFLTVTIAPGGVGKSSLIACEALAMVSGKNLLGVLPVRRLKVWLWNLEDPQEETARKIQAAAKHFDLTADDLTSWLFVNSGRDHALVIAKEVRGGTVILRPVIDNLVQQLREHGIDVLEVDPFVSCHEVSENDNSAIDMIAKEWSRVAELADCAVHLVHHTRKAPIGTEVNTDSSRGAKALTDAARVARALNQMTEEDAAKAGVDNHRLFFRSFNDKTNLAPPVPVSNWFKLASVWLDNGPGGGDSVGVVTHWDWPDAMAGVTGDDFTKVAEVIMSRDWRLDQRSTDWVGKAVARGMGLDEDDKRDKTRIAGLLKMWITAGNLVVVEGKDQQRRTREFVQVCSAKKGPAPLAKNELERT